MTIPIVMTTAGRATQAPADLRAQLDALVQAAVPGYTSILPGSLIEDVASTNTFALVLCDQFVTELINSLTPYGANEFVLNQLGVQAGVPIGTASNGSVYVVVTGPPGYQIPVGFQFGDGTNQYVVQDGGTIAGSGASGQTDPLFSVATTSSTFAIPAGTVTQIATSVPVDIVLTCTNPNPGTPAGTAETTGQYRARVQQAQRAAAAGLPTYLKTQLEAIAGVQARLVAVRQVSGGFQVLCGGGDPYKVGAAIYSAVPDFTALLGSAINAARNVTVTIVDGSDSYLIPFINPPAQTVSMQVTWNTTATNFVSDNAIEQAASQAIAGYVNAIVAGQPMNLFTLNATFSTAVAGIISPELITRLVFIVVIAGSEVAPSTGTGIIAGDPESFFETSVSSIVVARG